MTSIGPKPFFLLNPDGSIVDHGGDFERFSRGDLPPSEPSRWIDRLTPESTESLRTALDTMSPGDSRLLDLTHNQGDSAGLLRVSLSALDSGETSRFHLTVLEVREHPDHESPPAGRNQYPGEGFTKTNRELRMKSQALDQADIGLTITDVRKDNQPLIYVNDAFLQMTGYTREEVLGQNARFLRGPETDPEQSERIDRAIERGEPVTADIRNYRKDGTMFWNHIKLRPFREESGEVTHYLDIQQDVTERIESKRAVEKITTRLQVVLEGTDTGVWEWDVEANEISWDDQTKRMFGYDPEVFSDESECFEQRISGEDPHEVRERMKRALERDEPYENTYRIQFEDEHRWMKSRGIPLEREGTPVRMIGIQTDVTDLKNVEQELQEREEQFRQVAENINEAVWLNRHPSNEIIFLNPAYERIWGLDADRLHQEPMSFLKAVHPDDRQHVKDSLPLQSEGNYDIEYRVIGPDGKTRWVNDKATPIRNEEGEVYRIVGIAEDITRFKKAQRELERAKREAEEANQAKSQFLARMSHEIRTPLNAIMGMAELLSETSLNEEQEHYVDVFQNSSEILLNLINDVLDLSKIEAGEMELEETYFDLESLVIDTAEFFAQRAHNKGLELNVFVDPDCPPAVKADPNRFRQIIVNLLGNALKFTDEGEVNLNLSVTDLSDGEVDLHLDVEDTGSGISQDKQEEIFEEFGQADESSSREHQGTGLGLSICQHLLNKMGGTIDVESTPGVGSRFFLNLSLPCRDQPVSGSRFDNSDPEVLRDHSVLVVDDNRTNREIFTKYLEPMDMEVEQATGGTEALNRLKDESFDLILLDKRMPGMDGFTVIEQLPEDVAPDTIVMASSDAIREDRQQARSLGLGDYHVKPISRIQLLESLTELLRKDDGDSDRAGSGAPEEAGEDPVPRLEGRVLLVEDNDNNRLVVTSYLQGQELEIDDAVNGEQALSLMKENDYDLVLMDLEMPTMDGYEAAEAYRTWEENHSSSRLDIIALTAHAMEGAREDALNAGCDGYLTKPVQKQTLLSKLAEFLAE